MKILITTDWYAPVVNGVVTSVLGLERELLAMGHEVRILTLSGDTRSRTEGRVTYLGAMGAGKIYPGARVHLDLTGRHVRNLLDWRPDVVHSQCEFSTFLAARRISGALNIPLVHTYHTVYEDYTHYFSPSQRWGRKMVCTFTRWIAARTDRIIAPTGKVETLLNGYQIGAPVRVVPTGIDAARFAAPASPERLTALRQKLDLPADRLTLVYLGRLAEEKNVDELLDLMAEMGRDDLMLLLVGDGPYREALERRVRTLGLEGAVRFAGMVPPAEAPDYYHLGDLFVSASRSETQGLTYLEALAAGLPALCRRDECLRGVIADGVNGWQYDGAADFTEHLAAFAGDCSLRVRLRLGAWRTGEEHSTRAFALAALAVYEEAREARSLRLAARGAAS